MARNLLLGVEIQPGADSASARITDGIHIRLIGRVRCSQLNQLLQAVQEVKEWGSDQALLRIGKDFGLKPSGRGA